MQNSFYHISHTSQLNELFYNYLYNNDNEGILILSNHVIVFANKYFQKNTGYTLDFLNEINFFNVVPEYAHQVALNVIDNLSDKKEIQYLPFYTADKGEVTFDIKGNNFQLEGENYTLLKLTIPENNRGSMNIDFEMYHSILNSVSENILIIDQEFNITQTIKVKTDKFIDLRNLSEAFSLPALKQMNKVLDKKWKNDEVRFFEIQNYKSFYEARLIKFRNLQFVFSFNEISLRKRIEHKLIDSQIQLGQLNKEKDLMLSIIAHDLKNPFNIIKGFCSVLMKNGKNLDKAKRDEIIEHIYTSSTSGHNLLETLLEWSRSQSNHIMLNREKVQIREIAGQIFTYFSIDMQSKSLKPENNIDGELIVHVDKNMISTILRNLISNAIKFSETNGTITLSSEIKDNFAEIHIKDTGIGMNDRQKEVLFKIGKVYSTKGTNGERGTGLGLILCKEFTEKHGGTISVNNEIKKGTEFIFTLPLKS